MTRKQKICHKAKMISQKGGVSPLCAKKPYAINLSRATYVMYSDGVTCRRCLKILAERPEEGT